MKLEHRSIQLERLARGFYYLGYRSTRLPYPPWLRGMGRSSPENA